MHGLARPVRPPSAAAPAALPVPAALLWPDREPPRRRRARRDRSGPPCRAGPPATASPAPPRPHASLAPRRHPSAARPGPSLQAPCRCISFHPAHPTLTPTRSACIVPQQSGAAHRPLWRARRTGMARDSCAGPEWPFIVTGAPPPPPALPPPLRDDTGREREQGEGDTEQRRDEQREGDDCPHLPGHPRRQRAERQRH